MANVWCQVRIVSLLFIFVPKNPHTVSMESDDPHLATTLKFKILGYVENTLCKNNTNWPLPSPWNFSSSPPPPSKEGVDIFQNQKLGENIFLVLKLTVATNAQMLVTYSIWKKKCPHLLIFWNRYFALVIWNHQG